MFAGVYLDDIVVYSDTWENHLVQLEQIFHRLSDANLTMKMEKCMFAAEDCVYLGYRIGRGGVIPEESKVRDVAEMPQPQTKREVRTFLGMTEYYRCFIQHYATVAEPLTELKKRISWRKLSGLMQQS